MCGILGYLGKIEKGDFERSLDRLAHRGPDSGAVYQNQDISLGHRRLSIIDLSANANQPMHLGERYSIVFNGEIYNYLELRSALEKHNIVFKTNSDTEVLLQAYITWGEAAFPKLNGMWALAIWDAKEKTLLLSRDRMGKKPLFYGFHKGAFFFASEMKGLYDFIGKIEIDQVHVAEAIENVFAYEATEKCLIKGISRFPAASIGILKNNALKIHSFWNPLNPDNTYPSNYQDQKEFFRELFLDACKIRMQSDVAIGTALSGGLDSSSVICAMSHLAKQHGFSYQKDWQHAFVASFPGTSVDETVYAKEVTDFLKVPASFISIDPVVELDNIYKQAYLFEEIYYAPTIPFVQLYRSIRKEGVKVSIDGHGADELFAGYPFDMHKALIDAMPNPARFKEVLQAIENTSGQKISDKNNYLKYALKHKYPLLANLTTNKEKIIKKDSLGFLNSQLYASSFESILPTLLRNYDRYSMINGVEIRMPFLDYRIVEFAFALPYHSKIRNGFGKAIVRDALKGIVPESILYRKKKIGFNSPMESWMTGSMKTWILDTVNSADFNSSALIDAKAVRASLLEAMSGKALSYSQAERSFAQIMPFIWEKSLKLHHE